MAGNNTNEEMESLDSALSGMNFGIDSVTTISDEELQEMIFNDSKPEDVVPIKEKTTKEKEPVKNVPDEESELDENLEEEIKNQILVDAEEDKDDPKITAKTKQLEKEEKELDDNTFASLTKDLLEIGVFTPSEDETEAEPTTPEEFRDRFLKEVSIQANSQIYNFLMQEHGEEGVEMFNSIFVKKIAPKDYLAKYTEIESLKDLDISKEDNQERVYRAYYKKLGWNDEKIDSKITKLKDYGDLEEEATTIHEKLLEAETESLQELETKKEQEAQVKLQRKQAEAQAVNGILAAKLKDKEFDGIPVTDKVAREAFSELNVEKYQLPTGERLTEFDKAILELKRPENLEKKVKLWLLLRSDLDLTKVKTSAISKKADNLFNSLTIKEKSVKRTNTLPVNNSFGSGL